MASVDSILGAVAIDALDRSSGLIRVVDRVPAWWAGALGQSQPHRPLIRVAGEGAPRGTSSTWAGDSLPAVVLAASVDFGVLRMTDVSRAASKHARGPLHEDSAGRAR